MINEIKRCYYLYRISRILKKHKNKVYLTNTRKGISYLYFKILEIDYINNKVSIVCSKDKDLKTNKSDYIYRDLTYVFNTIVLNNISTKLEVDILLTARDIMFIIDYCNNHSIRFLSMSNHLRGVNYEDMDRIDYNKVIEICKEYLHYRE